MLIHKTERILFQASQYKWHLGSKFHNTLIQKFSTTDQQMILVQEITLMDSFQQLFEYCVVYGCGIPKVKMMGTIDEWKQLRNAPNDLRSLNLSWWIDELIPILDKLLFNTKPLKETRNFGMTFMFTDKGDHHMDFQQHQDGQPFSFLIFSILIQTEE